MIKEKICNTETRGNGLPYSESSYEIVFTYETHFICFEGSEKQVDFYAQTLDSMGIYNYSVYRILRK